MEVALFEDDAWSNFVPISSTRHVAQQLIGDAPLYQHAARKLKGAEVTLIGREYLAACATQRTKLRYNDPERKVLLVNARVDPLVDLRKWAKLPTGSAVLDGGDVVAASVLSRDLPKVTNADGSLSRSKLATMARGLERLESPTPMLFSYPWDFVEANSRVIRAVAKKTRNNLVVSKDAGVEDHVYFDTRGGPVVVGNGARIEAFSRISGPCYIGNNTTVHSALLRGGTTIADGCRVGGEVELSIVYRRSAKVHFGFLGHSIVGEWVNFAAGAVTSDLKHTFGNVRMMRGKDKVDTGLMKVGSFIGDMAKVSIGTMIYSGKSLGVGARVEGLVEKDVPDFVNYSSHRKSAEKLDLDRVIEMQVRAKKRRDEVVTTEERRLISHLYGAAR